jgi:F5/8 type C domain-containing protein
MILRFIPLDLSKPEKNRAKNAMASFSLMMLLVLSLSPYYISGSKPANAQVNIPVCKESPVVKVAANGERGAGSAGLAVDKDPATRWANQALGSFIQLNLGQSKVFCDIDIAWYRGDERAYNFVISTSNDGVVFKEIAKAKSTGQTTFLERYNIPNHSAQYVRITVNGNTDNDLGSITEMSVRERVSTEQQTCTVPKITGISATGNDGNKPQNTLDNNANTRWSNSGLPSWIQYNLGSSQRICDVDISWYRGNQRVNTFTISASEDGQIFRTIFIGKSSGKTISPEAYNVIDTNAKYLRITDMRNSENSWASITEVDINGDTQTPSPSPSPSPSHDPFGIQKIYPTKAGGEEWFMDMTDGKDPRSSPPSLTKNSDGSFKVGSSKVRYGVFTTDGYNPGQIDTLDHGTIAQTGFMQSSKDWKNVEMTGYVKVNSGQSGENFAWYARGGRHTGDGNPEGCEGVAYKADLGYDGRTRFAKEQWHVSYDFTDHKNPMSSIEDKWVGFKGIMWNMVHNGETVVKMEIWVDKNEDGKQDGPWVEVDENTDSGGWGNSGSECGGASDQIITWGGPIATFRWDGATDVDIKNFSVREIQPPS